MDIKNLAKPATHATPVQLWQAGMHVVMLGLETQMVVALRTLGMVGMWAVRPSENHRMVAEKPAAFARSANAAMKAAMTGKRPDEVLSAAVKPLRQRTTSNMRRLQRSGPRMPYS